MTKVLSLHGKKEAKNYKEYHMMSCTKEDNWLVWRCHECSRKVQTNLKTHEFKIERKGNFFAHHTFQSYQPSTEEWENAGVSPMKIDFDFAFPQPGDTVGPDFLSDPIRKNRDSESEK